MQEQAQDTTANLLDAVLENTVDSLQQSQCPEGYTEITAGVKRIRINKSALEGDSGSSQYIVTIDDGEPRYYTDVQLTGVVEFERRFVRERVLGCSSINCYGVSILTKDPIYVKE